MRYDGTYRPRHLSAFHDSLYCCFDRRTDALLFEPRHCPHCAGTMPSPVHLSLEPSHRRGRGSFYVALDHGKIYATALREQPPVYAVDISVVTLATLR